MRRKAPRVKPERALIYESSPTKRLVAWAVVEEIIKEELGQLWNSTKHSNGVTKEEFFDYFQGLDEGFAIKLGSPRALRAEWSLQRLREEFEFRPPQNYCFPKEEFLREVNPSPKGLFQNFLSLMR